MSIPAEQNRPLAANSPTADHLPGAAWWRTLIDISAIVTITLLVYFPALRGTFILDDDRYLTENPLVASSDGLYRIWFTNEAIDYWPMTYTSFWFEWRLWGMNPVGYHVTNLVLHIASTLLLWQLLRKLAIPGALLAAIIFAVHPVNVQVVAWVSERNELLAILFLMLAFLAFVRNEQQPAAIGVASNSKRTSPFGRWYWLSLLAFLLAILSKISVVSMPVALLLIAWWLHGRVTKWDLLRTVPFFGIALLMMLVQLAFQKHGDPIPNPGLAERLAGAGAALWFYFGKAFVPIDLLYFYPHWNINPGEILWWLPFAVALAITIFLAWKNITCAAASWRALFFAWAFCCVALSPALGIIQNGFMVYSLVADRYEHLALIGLAALVAAGWSYLHFHLAQSHRWLTTALALGMVAMLATLGWLQSCRYGDTIKLYEATVALNHDPRPSVMFHGQLGSMLLMSGRIPESIDHFEKSISIKPHIAETHHGLANAFMAAGRPQEAIQHFQEALRLRPDYVKSRCNLGIALLSIGQLPEAIVQFQQVLQLDPRYADAHYFLANALTLSGRPDEAREQYELTVQCDPLHAEAHNNLGSLLMQSGKMSEAIDHYQQALRGRPDDAKAESNLAIALASTGQIPLAIEHFQRSLKLEPNNADTHHNLGVALAGANRLQEAVDQFIQTLQLQPARLPTYAKLTALYAQLKQPEKALATADKALELARSTGQTQLATQIEDWLREYRAGLQRQSGKDTASP